MKAKKVLMLMMASACVLSQVTPVIEPEIVMAAETYKLSLSKTSITLEEEGSVAQLVATPTPSNMKLIWTSSNPNVATVDEYGTVTAKGEGQTTIIVKSAEDGNVYKSCTITCDWKKVTAIKLNKTKVELNSIGAQAQITAAITPIDAINKNVEWSSSNPNVVSVNSDGTITAAAEGEAVIYCKSTDGGSITSTCAVSVVLPRAQSIKLNSTNITVKEIDKVTSLVPTISPSNAVDKNVVWSSSDENIAKVVDGQVFTGKVNGTVTITCTSIDNPLATASCVITVKIPVTQIGISQNNVNTSTGSMFQLFATTHPQSFVNTDVVWSSSNTAVASVDSMGNVKTKKAGKAVITVASKDYSKITTTCTVNVSPNKTTNLQFKNNEDSTQTLSWDAVPGANGYYVYQLKNNVWRRITDTPKTSFCLKKNKPGNYYQYKVVSYYKEKDSKGNTTLLLKGTASDVFGVVKRPEATKLYVVSLNNNSIKVKWNNIACDKYKVSLYKGKKLVKTVNTAKSSYIFKNLKKNTAYKVVIAPYTVNTVANQNTYGPKTALRVCTVAEKPANVVKLKISDIQRKSVTLSWSVKDGEKNDGYNIYVKKNGNWQLVGISTKRSFTVDNLSRKTDYEFAVSAFDYYEIGSYNKTVESVKSVLSVTTK